MTTVLSKEDIRNLLKQDLPLVEEHIDLAAQLQPNGIDLTLREVALFQTMGQIAVDNNQRMVSNLAPLIFDGLDFVQLLAGAYLVTYNEVVHLPNDVMALAYPRSSLLRCGANIQTAVWDAGYNGRAQSLMVIYNPQGIRLQKNARIVQLVFFRLTRKTEGYHGAYQGENIQ
jgi:dUTP pyrophosphatase